MTSRQFVAVVIAVIAAVAAAITWGISIHMRGDYASMDYSAGVNAAEHVYADTYGLSALAGAHFDTPPVVNSHLDRIKQRPTVTNTVLGADSGQVRVYHLIGARGVRYCIGVWDRSFGTKWYYGRYFVTKNCDYAENQ